MSLERICDICKKVIVGKPYKLELSKRIDAELSKGLYEEELCQSCFVKFEQDLNRRKKMGNPNDL